MNGQLRSSLRDWKGMDWPRIDRTSSSFLAFPVTNVTGRNSTIGILSAASVDDDPDRDGCCRSDPAPFPTSLAATAAALLASLRALVFEWTWVELGHEKTSWVGLFFRPVGFEFGYDLNSINK